MLGLLLPNSYLFSVFFKMVFLVVFFGALHGLFLLPVLLSLFGPGSCSSHDDENEIKLSAIEKSFPHPYCIPHPQFTLNGAHLSNSLKNQTLMSIDDGKTNMNMEKDLGLGTSEENSSESSSHKSNKIETDVYGKTATDLSRFKSFKYILL